MINKISIIFPIYNEEKRLSKSLIDIYQDSIKEDHPIIFEKRKTSFMATNTPFVPNPKMICAKKGDTVIQNLIYFMNSKQDKGHFNQFQKLIDQHKKGGEPIIPFDSIVNTTKASFAAITSLKEGKWISIE